MRFWDKISLRGGALPSIFLFLSIACCFGCTRERTAVPAASAEAYGMTRQDFYYEVYRIILNDDLLRGVYVPVFTDCDPAALLCGEARYESGTYRERMHLLKTENASLMPVRAARYRQGGTDAPAARWIWRSPGDGAELWAELLTDYAAVTDKNKDAVVFLCETGLARLRADGGAYTLALYPDEPVSKSEADELLSAVRSYVRPVPENAVRTRDPEGNEILLCFSDSVSVFTFRSLTSYLQVQNELERSFVYFDETGTNLSLWINTATGGMFAVPLDFARGKVCALPYSASPALLRQRQGIAAAMLPERCREQFQSDAAQLLLQPGRQEEFRYEIGSAGGFISVSYQAVEESTGAIRIGIAAN